MKLRTVPLALVAAVLAVGCTDAPLGVTDDTLSAPAPEFLIGDSPLIVLIQDPNEPPELQVTVEVNKGIVNVKDEDKFILRMSASFKTPGGSDVGGVDPKDQGLTDPKDDGVRGGSTVAVEGCIEIPADLWTKLVAANDGSGIDATVVVELVMTDGAGKEHVLDTAAQTSTVDPKDDG